MVNFSLLKELGLDDNSATQEVQNKFENLGAGEIGGLLEKSGNSFTNGSMLKGKVVNIRGDDVVLEIGLKSEGILSLMREFDDPGSVEVGDEITVLLEQVESENGLVQISKRKADRIIGWETIVHTKKEGDPISGKVLRKIKGGLLVDIGVPVFLPASQVDIRRPSDIGEFINKTIDAEILKIDLERRNIVISRRKLLERHRGEAKQKLFDEIAVGQLRKGVVKNIADFGAFIDLGGVDGLLHITDMSWGRINHPSDIVRLDEEIEVVVLNVDQDKEKIALGLKQKQASPWEHVDEKYPVGTRIKGQVTNIMSYGAFVKLEEGVEGLVHISEMSWTKRINHPGEMLSVGEEVDVVVLEVNKGKQEISLGIKQTEANPWTVLAEKYPPGTVVAGKVRNLANYGAFIEIEEGIDGLLHISDMSWTKKIVHPSEMIRKGDTLQCVVLSVDQEKNRVALGVKQLAEDPWLHAIPTNYHPGMIVKGKVTKITNFGVFVELEPGLEGLLHISELSDNKIENPQEMVKLDDELEVKILRVDIEDRKIGLSLKRAQWGEERESSESERPAKKYRGGLEG
ncbi:MAG: 30S ribosomal protein S1 [Planctomycetes bacterium]|jgi:small subunit ribosomal protein S1|nr:30S ribosomal protein S1 [Planctomycetota bacterium]MDA8376832.1 30S ribosomal protein S1 [Planctomycetia bacterium]